MASIVIREQDNTTGLVLNEAITDVAFVPGFGQYDESNKDIVGVPTLVTSVNEFISLFGGSPKLFEDDTKYSEIGFTGKAYKDSDSIIFAKDTPDPGYVYALGLLRAGIPVYYCMVNSKDKKEEGDESAAISAKVMYNAFCGSADTPSLFEQLKDKGTYTIKYITTGGYPIYECTKGVYVDASTTVSLVKEVLSVCANKVDEDDNTQGRGDCIALIDHTNYMERPLLGANSVFGCINMEVGENSTDESLIPLADYLEFGAMFTPWMNYQISEYNCSLPASFAYLSCLGRAIGVYDNFNAVAGVERGIVKDFTSVCTEAVLTNTIANKYQQPTATSNGISINAITLIRPYSQTIWGNRTLQLGADKGVTAMGYLNLRNMVSDIKKAVYSACRRYMFEQNSDILWINFKAAITPTLDTLISGNGIDYYSFKKGTQSGKTKLYANITIKPVYAVESFDITVTLTDEEVSVVG